ncbi:hypothetical protein EDB84DRAFT_1450599 [Lactarius hengduanensis]|nr:hypothetical protein EDB84DRAFT_1450599 [Lactarius hengduanensis]
MSIPQSTTTPDNTIKLRPVKLKPPHPSNSSTMVGNTPKKEPSLPPRRAPLGEIRPQNPPVREQSQPKKIGRRSSKPILDWFQRKLGGTGRMRRASDVSHSRVANGDRGASARDKRRPGFPDSPRELSRVQSTPSRGRSSASGEPRRLSQVAPSSLPSRSTGISTNTNDVTNDLDDAEGRGDVSTYRSSVARDSMWSPTSNLEADEDASLRPFPPSSPPSPSPSRSSSSVLSNSRTFQSMAASTKPTTLLSVDLTGGMAHIAQAPPTPGTASRIPIHLWSTTGGSGPGSISFSALPPSPTSSYSTSFRPDASHPVQAPQHTTHHPRNNPRPSSPPLDNASVLTLASSAFGIPGARIGVLGGANDATSFSHFSQFGGSRLGAEDRSSHFILGDDLDLEGDRDGDASVRALRPRSSRRGSWESEASGWSAGLGNGGVTGLFPGAPAGKSLRSLSVKTGQMSAGGNPNEDDEDEDDPSVDAPSNEEPLEPSTPSGDGGDHLSPSDSSSTAPASLPTVSVEPSKDDTHQSAVTPTHVQNLDLTDSPKMTSSVKTSD